MDNLYSKQALCKGRVADLATYSVLPKILQNVKRSTFFINKILSDMFAVVGGSKIKKGGHPGSGLVCITKT